MSFDEEFADAVAAFERLLARAEDMTWVNGEELDRSVLASASLCDMAACVASQIGAEWDAQGRFRLDGSRSARARLARDTGWSERHAAVSLNRGKKLRQHHLLRDAFVNGEISADKVDVLCRAAAPHRRTLFAEAEADLVSHAKRLSHTDLSRAVTYWSDVADDHLDRDRAPKDHQARRFNASRTLGGNVALEGLLDPVCGGVVLDELDRINQQLFEEDWAQARQQHGDDATADKLPRTAAQRRADALVIMAQRSARPDHTTGTVPRPLFTIEIDIQSALRVCQLADGTPVTPGHLAPWITQADFERAIFNTPSRVIDISKRTRLFRGALRRAIEIRDKHCTFPGCTTPAAKCDIDHIVEYVDGGLTTQANGRLRCPAHNRQRPGRTTPPPQGP